MKECSTCGLSKAFDEFYKRADAVDGYNKQCKECQKPVNRRRYFLRKFNITVEEYDTHLANQKGLCWLCEKPETSVNKFGEVKMLAVHHCHKTGQVICLLCYRCNTALGMLNDDFRLLEKAARLMARFPVN